MVQLKNILLVDDDDDLREALSEQLVMTEDFEVFEADSGATAMERVKDTLYDLIILDVGLPDTDGRELCRLMRKQGVKSPVLMLTGHDSDADTILGLDAGANDYVSKPFKFPVLLARIRAQLRQHEQSEDAVFELGSLHVQAVDEDADHRGRKENPLDGERDEYPEVSLPLDRGCRAARHSFARGLGLQCRRHNAHPGDSYLPSSSKN